MPEVGTQHVFGAGRSTRCVGGDSETAVFPALGLVAFARGGPSGDEHGRMLDATRIALIVIGERRPSAFVT